VNSADQQLDECFRLMETLIELRQRPIRGALDKIRKDASMLHLDVLLLVYEFARTCAGDLLEVGAYIGGATIAAAFGIRDSGATKRFISIEPGGRLGNHRLASRNILRDLKRNLARQRVTESVRLIAGLSSDPPVVAAVNAEISSVGLLILDADGAVKRDLDCYGAKLAPDCWIIIDDYFGPAENEKVSPTRQQVDEFVQAGKLLPLGYHGWGTWVGKWLA
jgi:predicted O-methyltransferase YrrM